LFTPKVELKEVKKQFSEMAKSQPSDKFEKESDISAAAKVESLALKTSQKNIPTEPKVEKGSLILPFESKAFFEAWQRWKAYKKKEHNFHFKSKESQQAALNRLKKASRGIEKEAFEVIEQSMANGWSGFFELKNSFMNLTPKSFLSENTHYNYPKYIPPAYKNTSDVGSSNAKKEEPFQVLSQEEIDKMMGFTTKEMEEGALLYEKLAQEQIKRINNRT
jgi:hypothetical protein